MPSPKRIEVHSQAEFDACVNLGNIAIVVGCRIVARGNSSVVARENSSVVAQGNVFIRLWSALKIKASAHVIIAIHGSAQSIEGGRQMKAVPEPKTGAEYCEFNGIDRATAPYVVPNIDAAILTALESEKTHGLDMSGWHGQDCDETNWCETTHCRAGYAICMAGKAGFDLERKYGPEIAGRMIYAVSRPDMPLPDFYADDETALKDIKACAGRAA